MHPTCGAQLEQVESHFNDAFNNSKELNAITADYLGYGMHNTNECNFATNITVALYNLASVGISKMDAIKTLMQSSKHWLR